MPLQFIGFKNNQLDTDVVIQDSTSQQKLCANVAAQIVAFACGKSDENRNKNFEGGRPSSIIIGDQVNPASLGALLAHFENKIMFQGFLWNVNSLIRKVFSLERYLQRRFSHMRQTEHLRSSAICLISSTSFDRSEGIETEI